MSKTKQKKSTAGKSIAVFFIVFIILEGLIIFGLKMVFRENHVPSLGGYSFFLMDSDNMSPTVPKNTLVIAVNGKPSEDKISCAVLCNNVGDEGTTVAWLSEIGSKGDTVDGIVYTVYQDNIKAADGSTIYQTYDLSSDDVIGVAASHYVTAGKIVSFVITPFGIAICLAVPLVMLVLLELIVAITNRSDDDSYEDDGDYSYAAAARGAQQRGPRGQEGNASLDDFLYGGNGDEVYNSGRPNADYSEEFDGRRPIPGNTGRPQQQRNPQQNQRPAGKPDFSVNGQPGGFEDNGFGGFDEEGFVDDDGFADDGDFGGEPEFGGAPGGQQQFYQEQPAAFGGAQQPAAPMPEDVSFADGETEAAPDFYEQPAQPAQPAVDREYYEKAARIIEGDDYQPTPVPQPAPAQQMYAQPEPQPVPQPAPAPVQLGKPQAAEMPAAAPARPQQQRVAPPRPARPAPQRPAAPAQAPGAPRRRPMPPQAPAGAGSVPRRRPTAPGALGAPAQARQARPRPTQARPAQRRTVHKDPNAQLGDLMKKMSEEQQKISGGQE